MVFKEINPGQKLAPFVKCFYYYDAQSDTAYNDTVFPSGNMEMIFNLGNGKWQVVKEAELQTTPPVELWGQITKPMTIRSIGNNIMLGIRFYPHSMAYFFKENIAGLNNSVVAADELFGPTIKTLYAKLLETGTLTGRITLLEEYLSARLLISEKKHDKIKFVGDIVTSLAQNTGSEKIGELSDRNKISSRYLTQLFSQYTGLQPKLLSKINRFQYSLSLVNNSAQDLTSIAYDAGYFDQSHFIREFKMFTGLTPNAFASRASAMNQALAGN